MNIESVIQYYPSAVTMQKATPDFLIYCDDLTKHLSDRTDNKFDLNATGFSYVSLLDQLIESYPTICRDLDVCFLVYDTPDFDPIYSDPLTYLKDRYQLTAECFDVIDQGRLCVVNALHLLLLFSQRKKYQRAIMIGLEQNTLPVRAHHQIATPQQGGVAALMLSLHPSALPLLAANTFSTLQEALRFLKNFSLPADTHYFVASEELRPYDQFLLLPFNVVFHNQKPGVLPVFSLIEQCHANTQKRLKKCCVVLIEGKAFEEWGVVVLGKEEY